MRIPALVATLVLLSVTATGCGWQPYPHANVASTDGAYISGCSTGTGRVQCLLGQMGPTTTPAELRRIFRKLHRLGVDCSGRPGNVSCSGPGAGEGWEVFGVTGG
jgi:hypothetical protein